MFERLFMPLAPLALTTVGIVLSVYLFISVRREIQKLRIRVNRDAAQAQAEKEELRRLLAGITLRLQEAEERAGVLVPPTAPKSGLNLSKRTQVIRMSRRGDQPDNIAASLNLPKQEVELLLKVYRIAVDGNKPATA